MKTTIFDFNGSRKFGIERNLCLGGGGGRGGNEDYTYLRSLLVW